MVHFDNQLVHLGVVCGDISPMHSIRNSTLCKATYICQEALKTASWEILKPATLNLALFSTALNSQGSIASIPQVTTSPFNLFCLLFFKILLGYVDQQFPVQTLFFFVVDIKDQLSAIDDRRFDYFYTLSEAFSFLYL